MPEGLESYLLYFGLWERKVGKINERMLLNKGIVS
jgi:hypothetical protein